MVMALVDTVMVGRFAVDELAFLGIGLAPIVPLMLAMIGLMMGTLVLTAAAFGAGRVQSCGAVWRRSLPYALWLGLAAAVVCAFGESLLRLFGQSPEVAREGGRVCRILGLGIAPQLIFVTTSFFLEGVRRPWPAMIMMILGNLLNVLLNWLLIYGKAGLPALGAEGSAWATTVVRTVIAVGLVAYVGRMADAGRLGVHARPSAGLRSWTQQRRIGYAAGVSIGVEAAAFAALTVFAGWLGAYPLAAYSIVINLVSMVFMVAVGIGSATAVRVGIAHGRGDARETAWAGWTGLAVNTAVMGALALVFLLLPERLARAYTIDPALVALTAPAILFSAAILVADGGQAVMANALRGRGDTWVVSALQSASFFAVMVPVSWWLAFDRGREVIGLLEGVLVGCAVSVALLAGRFHLLSLRDQPDHTLSVHERNG